MINLRYIAILNLLIGVFILIAESILLYGGYHSINMIINFWLAGVNLFWGGFLWMK